MREEKCICYYTCKSSLEWPPFYSTHKLVLSAFAASDDVAPDGGLGGFLQQLVAASSHDLGERCV